MFSKVMTKYKLGSQKTFTKFHNSTKNYQNLAKIVLQSSPNTVYKVHKTSLNWPAMSLTITVIQSDDIHKHWHLNTKIAWDTINVTIPATQTVFVYIVNLKPCFRQKVGTQTKMAATFQYGCHPSTPPLWLPNLTNYAKPQGYFPDPKYGLKFQIITFSYMWFIINTQFTWWQQEIQNTQFKSASTLQWNQQKGREISK